MSHKVFPKKHFVWDRETMMGVVADRFCRYLREHGLDAHVEQHSKETTTEPYVEWHYSVYIEPRHEDEVALSERLKLAWNAGKRD